MILNCVYLGSRELKSKKGDLFSLGDFHTEGLGSFSLFIPDNVKEKIQKEKFKVYSTLKLHFDFTILSSHLSIRLSDISI